MIRYALKCASGHGFESWFGGADAFESLRDRGLVTCPECGRAEVDRALMAPRVSTARGRAAASEPPSAAEAPSPPPHARPAPPAAPAGGRPLAASAREGFLAELRARVERESRWVGRRFAEEARAIHEGRSDQVSVWGEADPEEARALLEDGVPVLPLPFGPRAKGN